MIRVAGFPERVWFATSLGWASRTPNSFDKERRTLIADWLEGAHHSFAEKTAAFNRMREGFAEINHRETLAEAEVEAYATQIGYVEADAYREAISRV